LEAIKPIIDAALDAVVVTDRDGIVRAWNAGAEQIFGWRTDEVIGRPMAGFIVPERLQHAHQSGMNRYLETGEAHVLGRRVEVDARRRNGEEFRVELAITEAVLSGERLFVAYLRDISERARSAEELRTSKARFEAAVLAVEGVLWTNDAEGRMTGDQPGWAALTGQTRADYEGFGWSKVVHPDDAAPTIAAWQEAVSERRPFVFEHRLRRRDHTWGVFSIRAIPTFSADGALREWVGVHTDITNARQTEAALKELNANLERRVGEALAERKLLAELVEGTDAFVQVLDNDFRWLAINKAAATEFERIFGVKPKIGQSMVGVLDGHPEEQEAVRRVWARALAGEQFTEVGEFGDVNRDRRTYEMKYNVLRDSEGRQVGAYQFVYDVTDRVQDQRRLIEAEAGRRHADELYRTYFESAPEALFIVGVTPDEDFVVEEVNPAHEAGVGLKLEDIQGRRIADILPRPAADRILGTYRHVLSTRQMYQYREVFELDGQRRHWDTSLVPMSDEQGRIIRIIGSSRDVTPQVQAEEALRQSQKMESMGQLTGGVAHDFNNLLTPIVGALDMLQRATAIGQRERRLLDGAMQSADRAKTLVQRLLAFARRQPLQPVPVDVSEVVRSMGDLIASITGPQIKVTVEADATPPACADQNQLEMAVLNLAVNARDAMPEGGALRLSVQEVVADGSVQALVPGHYVRVSVADTGVGMEPATLARAVEPFFSTKGVGQGTGLGLSMAHGLAKQLGGALLIHSTPGVGTNVELYLPRSEASTEADAGDDPPSLAVTGRGAVLVVDDEDLVRASTADMLSEAGFEVSVAASAEDALRAMRGGHAPDFVVTDHLMPGMSGHDLARTVRTEFPWTRVLVVSGYAQHEGLTSDVALLSKPFRSVDLLAALAALGA
jgi:PAS domain S-box-containing protein